MVNLIHARKWARRLVLLPVAMSLSGCLIVEGGFEGELYLEPGDSIQLHMGVGGCCYFILPLPSPAIWSISPTEGASVNPFTGVLTIDPDTPDGTVYTVSSGSAELSVFVFDPARHPLIGLWREETRIACDTGEVIVPEAPIQEVIFLPNGEFSVTWRPFELYRDYWGTYSVDLDAGTVEMRIDTGNYVPEDFDGKGTYSMDENGGLVLEDIWFGSRQQYSGDPDPIMEPVSCGHRLAIAATL